MFDHNFAIELIEEFSTLDEFERRAYMRSLFKDSPQEFLRELDDDEFYPVYNGPVLGILGSALFTGFTGGWALGAIALVSGLVQYWLTPQQQQRQADPKFATAYAGQINGGLAQLGDVIPAIFCNDLLDPTGGVETAGLLAHSRILTFNGVQTALTLHILSHGVVDFVDLDQTILNNQPISNYNPSDIVLDWRPGTQAQLASPEFPFFSQNVTVRDNNGAGSGYAALTNKVTYSINVDFTSQINIGELFYIGNRVVTIFDKGVNTISYYLVSGAALVSGLQIRTFASGVGGTVISNTTSNPSAVEGFFGTEAETSYLSPSKQYVGSVTGIPFNVIQKVLVLAEISPGIGQRPYYYVKTSSPIQSNETIYTYDTAFYRTIKRCNRIDLNFECNVWARNSQGELLDFAAIYILQIRRYPSTTYTPLVNLVIRVKNPQIILRGLQITNLNLGVYDVYITPVGAVDTSLQCIDLIDSGGLNTFFPGITITGGDTPQIVCQGQFQTAAGINPLADTSPARSPDNAAQRGPTLKLSSVNEIELPGSTAKARNLRYLGLAWASAKVKITERSSGGQSFLWRIPRGIVTHRLQLAGTADAGSSGDTLTYLPGFAASPNPLAGSNLRNCDKRVEVPIISATANTLIATGAQLEEGDNWVIVRYRPTCWWPEIYSYLAHDPRFGISRQVIADYYMDYPSLTEATRWVEGANEHSQSFAWHGIIDKTVSYAQLNAENSRKVLLQPWRGRGKAGFYPQKTPDMGGIFNETNAIDFKRTRTAIDFQTPSKIDIIYREPETFASTNPLPGTNPLALRYSAQSVSAESWNLRKGLVNLVQKRIEIPECTSRSQAKKTAQIMFNIGRYSGRIASTLNAKTIESLALKLGDTYRVMTAATQYKLERSGMVVEVGGGQFRLDRDFFLAEGLTTAVDTDDTKLFGVLGAGAQFGDILLNLENGVTSIITAAAGGLLTCSPSIPADTHYRIYSNNSTGLVAYIHNGGMRAPSGIAINFDVSLRQVWYVLLDGYIPEPGDICLIGELTRSDYTFQAVSIESSLSESGQAGEMSVAIVGSNYDQRMFDFFDITIIDRNNVTNEAV